MLENYYIPSQVKEYQCVDTFCTAHKKGENPPCVKAESPVHTYGKKLT